MFNQISIENIEISTFFQSANISPNIEKLEYSIKNNGLFEPIGVKYSKGKYALIYGYARILTYKQMQIENIPAKVYRLNDKKKLFDLYISNNSMSREFSPVEKINILSSFGKYDFYPHILEFLDLPENEQRLENYKKIKHLPQKIIMAIHSEKIKLEEAFLFYKLPEQDRMIVYELFVDNTDVGYGDLKKIIELLNRISDVEGVKLRDILSSNSVKKILYLHIGDRDKAKHLIAALQRRAYKRYYAMQDNLEVFIEKLKLPGFVQISHSKNFERAEIEIKTKVRSLTDIDRLISLILLLKKRIKDLEI